MWWKVSVMALCASMASAEAVKGPATVVDGDTLRVGGVTVRLHGIDTPERDQICQTNRGVAFDCGDVAAQAVEMITQEKTVTCQGHEQDRYGRLVASCYVDGVDVGAVLVRSGYAFAYQEYSVAYVPLEDEARAAKRGFWSGTVENPAVHRARDVSPAPDPACALKGNISGNGRIVHQPGDASYHATRIDLARGEKWFCTLADARSAGWRTARR